MTRARDTLVFGLTSFPEKESWAHCVREILEPQATEDLPAPVSCEALKTERWDMATLPRRSAALPTRNTAETDEEIEGIIPHWKANPIPLSREEVVFSVTQLQEFEHCPRWFFLRHYLELDASLSRRPDTLPKLPQEGHMPPKGKMSARECGEVVHRLLERMPLAWTDDASANHSLQQLAKRLGLPWEEQIFHWLQRFWKSEAGRLFLKAGEQRLAREVPFSWAIPGEAAADWVLFLRGQMDVLIEREEGHYLIVDYKTGAAETPQAYALQLACYRDAVLRLKNSTQVQTAVVFLREDSPGLHYLDEDKLSAYDTAFLRKVAADILEARASNVWPMRRLEECQAKRCQYIPFCYSS
jgi:ATP-dependent exoDNAse (exonuclease V) beta subunit